MITYSTKQIPPISAREALSAIDGAWDGRFEVSWHKGREVTVTDPTSGRKARCLFLGGEMVEVGACFEWLSAGETGFPPTFDKERLVPSGSYSFTSVIQRIDRAHESEMKVGAFYDSILLTDEEQGAACEVYAERLRNEGIGFVIAGSQAPEVAIMPVDARHLRMLLQFRIFGPKLCKPVSYDMLRTRYDYFVGKMVAAGVPAEKIASSPSEKIASNPSGTGAHSSQDLLHVTVEANAIMGSRLAVEDMDGTDQKMLRIPGMDCKLAPYNDLFRVTVIDAQTRVRTCLGVRMRNDAKVARILGGRPLGETMGAKMIRRAISG